MVDRRTIRVLSSVAGVVLCGFINHKASEIRTIANEKEVASSILGQVAGLQLQLH